LNNEEKWKGSLEPGKVADLILIDRDYLNCPLEQVKKIQVLWTMVAGKIVTRNADKEPR
jgi:predicted amidohydrolase YtcJ